ncbi:MAG TPA: protein kinase family protein, partial [Gammaproteobacteria bacterium]|nr:protein kinase family protein [Gammaproteobacteria bacterium]
MSVKMIKTADFPLKVDVKDLADADKGFLINQSEKNLIEEALKTVAPARYSKEALGKLIALAKKRLKLLTPEEQGKSVVSLAVNASYGVIKEPDGTLYAVYKGLKQGKHLGAGGYGKVKLVQNLRSGEWKALKVQEAYDEQVEMVKDEHTILKLIGESRGQIVKRPSKQAQTPKYNFVMNYAKGSDLYAFLQDHPQPSALRLLDIAIQSAETIQDIHKKGFLHCDIKPPNLLYDALNNQVTAVDYGIALMKDANGVASRNVSIGTRTYMAPELPEPFRPDAKATYSTATEVFALGKTLQEICGLSDELQVESPLKEDQELKKMLEKMTAENPNERPSLPEVIERLKKWRQDFLPVIPKTIGIVEVNDYETAADKKAFIAALKSVDEIVLVDHSEKENSIAYMSLRQEIERAGIAVRNEVLISDNRAELVAAIEELADKPHAEKEEREETAISS